MTPHDSVRKAAEAIRIHWTTQAQIGITELLPQKSFDEDTASIIESNCHVTEMEAALEKARKLITDYISLIESDYEGRNGIIGDMKAVHADAKEALAAIDALKGDK